MYVVVFVVVYFIVDVVSRNKTIESIHLIDIRNDDIGNGVFRNDVYVVGLVPKDDYDIILEKEKEVGFLTNKTLYSVLETYEDI